MAASSDGSAALVGASLHRLGLMLPGGGSLSTAQKTPRSWIASMNSLKPTGLTT